MPLHDKSKIDAALPVVIIASYRILKEVTMPLHFKNIGLMAKPNLRKEIIDTLQLLIKYLQSKHCQLIIEDELAAKLKSTKIASLPSNQLGSQSDLIIVVGGDGSLLRAAKLVADYQKPILGINRGKLGFLADITPNEIHHKLGDVLDGQFIEDPRFLLNATYIQDKKIMHQEFALNDIVLMPGKIAHLTQFEIYINDQFVCPQRADGLIVATPTGSTAYALSGGGPILHPQLDAVVLVPMFSHNLTSRPLVVNGNSEIRIIIPAESKMTSRLSCDGRESKTINPGGVIQINKKSEQLRLIHPIDYNYFETLRSKLHWEYNF